MNFKKIADTSFKKNSLWLLPSYMVVATYFCYEKVRRTMRTAIVSNLSKVLWEKVYFDFLEVYKHFWINYLSKHPDTTVYWEKLNAWFTFVIKVVNGIFFYRQNTSKTAAEIVTGSVLWKKVFLKKALKAFIKAFEAPQRSVKIKI